MPHSYSCNWQHIIFSTKERRRLIRTELQSELWPYIAGVATNHGMHPFAIGGIEDHIHILLTIPATKDIAKAVQEIKANSSRWMRQHIKTFQWQEGYGSFSVSKSNVSAVAKYIGGQREHHRRITLRGRVHRAARETRRGVRPRNTSSVRASRAYGARLASERVPSTSVLG